jgi:CRISPR-associated protein Csb1
MAENGSTMPIARIPDVFPLVLELDAMSLIHGFQVSNGQISFVGLRLARALTASIVGLQCQRVTIPGVKFNVGQVESESGQAIFQKPRVTAKRIEARFSLDVGLLSSLRLDAVDAQGGPGQHQKARLQLLLALALWKIASFLDLLSVELSLRTECKLRLKLDDGGKPMAPKAKCEGGATSQPDFPFAAIAQKDLKQEIADAHLPSKRSPLTLQFAS